MTAPLQRLGAGRLIYRVWHAPLGALRRCAAEGGPLEQWRTARGRREMTRAAATLPVQPFPASAEPLRVHLLTGKRFWDQTAFCLRSLSLAAARPVEPTLYDDGTIDSALTETLLGLFPLARMVTIQETRGNLERLLPAGRFPRLRDRWEQYPNIRKLIDPHLGSRGWKLVLDSDLLFFRRPSFLLNWLSAPSSPLHAVDAETSYGYSRLLMDRLAGAPVAEKVNVGLTGLRSDTLDWEKLERWCDALIAAEGTHYYLEQALIAMLVAGQPCAVAPAADYVTLPREPEVAACRAVMHHYVADSKPWYFRRNWRRFCPSTPPAAP